MNKYLNQGYEIWPNYFDANKIDIIKKKLDHYFEKNENLGPAVNVSILKEEELNTYGAERDEVQKKNKNFFIKKEDLDKGVDYYKNLQMVEV